MKKILIKEIKKEVCNAQALGAFNEVVEKGYRDAKSLGGKNAVEYWKYNMVKGVQQENSTREYGLAKGAYRYVKTLK